MTKRPLISRRRAQQLIEFALVMPILMIFIFIIVEFGAAINSRATIAEAIKMSMQEVNKLTNLDGDTATKEATVRNFLQGKVTQYLINHNIPNSGGVSVKVKYNSANNTALAFVSYEYFPYFLIAGLAGENTSSITFSTTQTINPNIFKPNQFPGGLFTTQQLSSFDTNGGGILINRGALVENTAFNYNDATFNIREHIVFILRLYESSGTHPYFEYDVAHARLVDWIGNDLLPPNVRVNLRTGTLEARSPYYQSGSWFDTRIPYAWVLSSLGFTHVIYVKYNSDGVYMPDNSSNMFRLRFNTPDPLYNKEILFCGTGGTSLNCDGDQRNTSTVNERALRMNPRFDQGAWDNDYIIGTMEPIFVNPTTHDFLHVKGSFVSYTPNYISWNPATWNQQYFMTINQPRIIGLAEEIYHIDHTNSAINPFFQPFRYRFKLFEHDVTTVTNRGVYAPSVAAPAAQDDDLDDGDGNIYYQVDIVDVYIDSDGDGIPDAWDRDPGYFDANVNGILDGNEISDFWIQTRCTGGTTGICDYYRDNLNIVTPPVAESPPHNVYADKVTPVYISSPTEMKYYYISTPYRLNGGQETDKTSRYLPIFKEAYFARYEAVASPGTRALYIDIDGTGNNYTRKVPSWWDLTNAALRRPQKVDFIHGTQSGQNIVLNPSPEFTYFINNNIFSNNTYVTRTAPGW